MMAMTTSNSIKVNARFMFASMTVHSRRTGFNP
jgi:hypothetical protein